MRRQKSSKGQVLILIILVLIGLIIVFGLLSALSGRNRAAPTVIEASWLVNGNEVTTATLGNEVKAQITIQATEEYVGSIVVKIRKDVASWFDNDFHMSTIPVDLAGGERKTLEVEFTPDQASAGGFRGLRGYFVEIEFGSTGANWVMENSYPPRLTIRS